MKRELMIVVLAVLITAFSGVTNAEIPPEHMNYQGVLRDAAGNPLDGSFDMVFRLYNAETGGDLTWGEEHLDPGSGGTGQVMVTGGLFNVALGTGFRMQESWSVYFSGAFIRPDVWLEVQVGTEILAPRTQVRGAGYSLNTAYLDGRPPTDFLDTSYTAQTKRSTLSVESTASLTYGIEGSGPSGGGLFEDSDNTGVARVGYGDRGINASGSSAGGFFSDTDSGTWAYTAFGSEGFYTNGDVHALGRIRAGGDLEVSGTSYVQRLNVNSSDLYLNQNGPDADSSIYFHEGTPTGARMFWNDSSVQFEFSHKLRVPAIIRSTRFEDDDNVAYWVDPAASGISGQFYGDLLIGQGQGSDNDYLYFDQLAENLQWNNSKTRFEISDELAISGPLQTGSIGLNTAAYNRLGSNVPIWADIQASNDLFVSDDVEVGGELALSKVIRMEAQETAGADGDQAIYFYDSGSPTSNYIQWDDLSTITCGTIGNVSSGFKWNIVDNTDAGWVFANGADSEAVIDELGNLEIDGSLHQSGSCDLAETFFGPSGLTAGTVVVLDPDRSEGVRESYRPYDGGVAGVVTTRPGVLLSGPSADAYPVWEELEQVGEMLAALPPEAVNTLPGAEGEIVELDTDLAALMAQRRSLEQRASELELELDTWARGDVAVALVGRVPVKADASYGPIRKGDYLTTSATPGHAGLLDVPGPYLGIAMDDLPSGQGEVLVFLSKGWYGGAVATDGESVVDEPAVLIAEVQTMEAGLELVLDRDANDRSRFSIHKDGGNGLSSEVFRVDEQGNVFATGSFRPAAMDVAEFHPVSEPVGVGDVLVVDRERPGQMALGRLAADPAVTGIVSTEPGMLLGSGVKRIAEADPDMAAALEIARTAGDDAEEARLWAELEQRFSRTHAAIALSGTVPCKVDAGFGAIDVGDLLTVSPTAGHAMRAADPAPQGTVLGKALEPLEAGTGMIQVLVMMR